MTDEYLKGISERWPSGRDKQVTVTFEGEDPVEVAKWTSVLRTHTERLGFVAQRIHPAAFIIVKEKDTAK